MVSFLHTILAIAFATTTTTTTAQAPAPTTYFRQQLPAASTTATAIDPSTLPVGVYYRPTGAIVSGQVGATTPFVRSPCPALNALANHGFFPRDGRKIRKQVFIDVLQQVFNLDRGLASFHATLLKGETDLSDLGKHNFIEHDFSVVHADAYYQQDPAQVDAALANDLLARAQANSGVLGVQQFGEAAAVRMGMCKSKPSGCKLSGFHRSLAFREAASILLVFGGSNTESCRADFAKSFLVDERIPDGWQKPTTQVRLADLSATGRRIEAAMKAVAP